MQGGWWLLLAPHGGLAALCGDTTPGGVGHASGMQGEVAAAGTTWRPVALCGDTTPDGVWHAGGMRLTTTTQYIQVFPVFQS